MKSYPLQRFLKHVQRVTEQYSWLFAVDFECVQPMRLTLQVGGKVWYRSVNRQQLKQKSTLMDWMRYTCRRSEWYFFLRRLTGSGSGSIKTAWNWQAASSFVISTTDSLKVPLHALRLYIYMYISPTCFLQRPKQTAYAWSFGTMKTWGSQSSRSGVASCFAHARPAWLRAKFLQPEEINNYTTTFRHS